MPRTRRVDLGKNARGELIGTFGSPAQGEKGLPLATVAIAGREVRFAIKATKRWRYVPRHPARRWPGDGRRVHAGARRPRGFVPADPDRRRLVRAATEESEKVFWRKVLDIYATSIDYDPRVQASQQFFATVQNKIHWAAHGHTAAEIIAARADATKPNMGMTSWSGDAPRKADAMVAKNYLGADELEALNRIVTAYLEFAELQAIDRRPMYMADWIAKLDDFLKLSDREILNHAGRISHEAAMAKAELEYDHFAAARAALPAPVEHHFEEATREVKQLEKARRAAIPVPSTKPRKKR